jgi:Haem-degrading
VGEIGPPSPDVTSNGRGACLRPFRQKLECEPWFVVFACRHIVGLAALGSAKTVAADPLPTETFKILPPALAVEAAEAAIASCKALGYNVSVAIVDRAGNLKLLLVGDGARAFRKRLVHGSTCILGLPARVLIGRKISRRQATASADRPRSRSRQARLVAARNSQDKI